MKNIFLFSFFFSLFLVSQSSAQWWVQGGNLLWPYGDVTIQNDLNVEGTITNDGVRPYKVYTALLTQSGTDAPTAIVLENTIGEVTWSYAGPALYELNSNNLFTLNKTVVIPTQTLDTEETGAPILLYPNGLTLDILYFAVVGMDGSPAFDGVLLNTPIEIRVYP